MTKETLDRANYLVSRIKHLEDWHKRFTEQEVEMDDSMIRMTGFVIEGTGGFMSIINHADLIFLIDAIRNEISRTEDELDKL